MSNSSQDENSENAALSALESLINQLANPSEIIIERFDPKFASFSFFKNSQLTIENQALNLQFFPQDDQSQIFELRYNVNGHNKRPIRLLKGKMSIRLQMINWRNINYLAYGWMDGKNYWHVKNFHPLQNIWLEESLTNNSYEIPITQKSACPQNMTVDTVRIFIKGKPMPSGGTIKLNYIAITEDSSGYCILNQIHFPIEQLSEWYWQNRSKLLSSIDDSLNEAFLVYAKNHFPDYKNSASKFLKEGILAMRKVPDLRWNWDEVSPKERNQWNTTQYLWHALNHVQPLLLAFNDYANKSFLPPIQSLIEQWINDNILTTPEKHEFYTWYDHGTAERLMVLSHAWFISLREKLDIRFITKLLQTLIKHADLIASEWFYAKNQPIRYHNHAVFQDMALFVAATILPTYSNAGKWKHTALTRLNEQFAHLVTEQGVSIENSYGYHVALQDICKSIASWQKINDSKSEFIPIYKKMLNFTHAVSYGDTRGASYGDSFRLTNDKIYSEESKKAKLLPCIFDYTESGYFIAQGVTNNLPWKLLFLAPSKSSTHKHEDNLNIIFWAGGVEWLIDPGFHSHQYKDFLTAYARGVKAHNVPFVNTRFYSVEPEKSKLFPPTLDKNGVFTASGVCESQEDVKLTRSITGNTNSNYITITDSFACELTPDEEILFYIHLGESIDVEIINQAIILSTELSDLIVTIKSDNVRFCNVVKGGNFESYDQIGGWSFPSFGTKEPINTIVCKLTGLQADWSISWDRILET